MWSIIVILEVMLLTDFMIEPCFFKSSLFRGFASLSGSRRLWGRRPLLLLQQLQFCLPVLDRLLKFAHLHWHFSQVIQRSRLSLKTITATQNPLRTSKMLKNIWYPGANFSSITQEHPIATIFFYFEQKTPFWRNHLLSTSNGHIWSHFWHFCMETVGKRKLQQRIISINMRKLRP